MAINYPGPYELRIEYLPTVGAVQDIPHTQRLNIDLEGTPAQGDAFGNYNVVDKNGATGIDLETVVEDYLAVLNAMLNSGTDIGNIELWKYPVFQSFDAVFWSTYTPTANVGTSGTSSVAAGQDILTFRTQEGGIMKINIMEGIIAPGVPRAYGSLNANAAALVDFVLDGDGETYSAPFLARDTSYPFSFIKDYPGQNEKLWKTRNGR